jgi:hypothetical protein
VANLATRSQGLCTEALSANQPMNNPIDHGGLAMKERPFERLIPKMERESVALQKIQVHLN